MVALVWAKMLMDRFAVGIHAERRDSVADLDGERSHNIIHGEQTEVVLLTGGVCD